MDFVNSDLGGALHAAQATRPNTSACVLPCLSALPPAMPNHNACLMRLPAFPATIPQI